MKKSIRDKIKSAFNVVNGLMVVVALTGMVALLAVVHKANQAVAVGARLETIGLEIQTSNLQAGRFEKEFLLNIKAKGVEKAKQEHAAKVAPAVAKIEELCAAGARIASVETDRARFQRIQTLVRVYAKAFADVVAARERRGFVDTGAEGEFRNAVHEIEANIKYSDKLEIAMLTLRRSEKDYIMRGFDSLVALTHENVKKLKSALSQSSLSPAEKAETLKSAEVYERNFSILVAADREVDAKMAVYQEASGKLETASDDVAKAGFKASRESLASSSTTAWAAILIGGLLSIGAVSAGMRYGSRISTNIIRPVRRLTDVAERVSMGDLAVKVEHTSDDEIGDLEDSLARLITAVKFFKAESEEAADAAVVQGVAK
jgi:methyl-accepting chemotaxis protein